MGQNYDMNEMLENLNINIFSNFSYPFKIALQLRNGFKELIEKFLKGSDNKLFTILYENYITEIRKTLIYNNNQKLLITIFFRNAKKVLEKEGISIKGMDFIFPIGSIRKTIKRKMEKFNPNIHKVEIIEIENTGYFPAIQITNLKKGHYDIFKALLGNAVSNALINEIIEEINYIIAKIYPEMIEFFIKDGVHTQHLTDIIDFQKRFGVVVNKLVRTGSIDSTRRIRLFAQDLLRKFLGISKENIEYLMQGRRYKEIKENDTVLYNKPIYFFTNIVLKKREPDFKDNMLVNLVEKVERFFKGQGKKWKINKPSYIVDISTSTSELKFFMEEFFKENTTKYIEGFTKSYQEKYGTSSNPSSYWLYVRTMDTSNYLKRYRLSMSDIVNRMDVSGYIELNHNHFFEVIDNKSFRIRNIDEIIQNLTDQLDIELYTKTKVLVPTLSRTYINLKIFDIIEDSLKLIDDIHRFFLESMDLKPLTQKKKVSEKWNGSRGYLDIEKTIQKSLDHGFITPMQSYRKKILESPPTIFVFFDLSSSMSRETRICQFILLTLLSFFEKDVAKIIIGYIKDREHSRKRPKALFKSQARVKETKVRKETQYIIESDEDPQIANIVERLKTKFGSVNLSNIMSDYFDNEYDDAIRDFLDNEMAGTEGTDTVAFNFLPAHPDLDNRGLKYVFVLTDHQLSDQNKYEFVDIANELLSREDVRFFFIWDMNLTGSSNPIIDQSDDLIEGNQSSKFFTKHYVIRKLTFHTLDDDGIPINFNKNYESLSFKEVEKIFGEKTAKYDQFSATISKPYRWRYKSKQEIEDYMRKEMIKLIALVDTYAKAEIYFLNFLYQHYEVVHISVPSNIKLIGEIKNILHRLQEQDFFIP